MLAARIYAAHLANLPPVPSRTPIYKTTLTTTTDETTTTWTGVDIGEPHPNRLVILVSYVGAATATPHPVVNGISAGGFITANNEFNLYAISVKTGTTATVTVSGAGGSARKAVSVYVAYPENHMPLDSGNATANVGTDANVANIKVQAGGFLIYGGGQHATLGAFTTTWNGAGGESVTEDVDAQLEATASYTMGRIATILRSDDLGDVNMAEDTSGTKRLVVVSWGPPRAQAA
jgi:hypothetical protein